MFGELPFAAVTSWCSMHKVNAQPRIPVTVDNSAGLTVDGVERSIDSPKEQKDGRKGVA